MKYPKFLVKNGIIHLVSPSLGCNIEPYHTRLKTAIEFFKNEGYIIKEGENIFDSFSGTKEEAIKRGLEINRVFEEKDDSIIMSVGGGELMTEVLDYIDFNILKNNPKWFMGYSDNTNLTFLLPTICDICSIYGPHAGEFSLKPRHSSINDTLALLMGKKLSFVGYDKWETFTPKKQDPLESWYLTEDKILKNYPNKPLSFKGRLIGGCLDVLLGIVGTKYDKVKEFTTKYQTDGIIWFIEACDLNVLGIRRAFVQLKRAGWFNNAKGFIIGRPYAALNGEMFGVNQYNAITSILEELNIPIIFDADIGHFKPAIPLLCGAIASVSSIDNELTIEFELN